MVIVKINGVESRVASAQNLLEMMLSLARHDPMLVWQQWYRHLQTSVTLGFDGVQRHLDILTMELVGMPTGDGNDTAHRRFAVQRAIDDVDGFGSRLRKMGLIKIGNADEADKQLLQYIRDNVPEIEIVRATDKDKDKVADEGRRAHEDKMVSFAIDGIISNI